MLIYNVFFHPLRKYPGPTLAVATQLTFHIFTYRGQYVSWMRKQHDKYGPIVRFSPDRLSSIEPDTWKEVYGHHVPQWQKDPTFFGADPYGGEPGILRSDDASHARQRKLVSHAFSDKALKEQESIIRKYVSLLTEKVGQAAAKQNGKVNLVAWFNFCTFDVMADLSFGESLQQLEGSMYSPWVKSIFGHVTTIALKCVYSQWKPFDRLLAWTIPTKIKVEQANVFRFSAEKVEERLNREVERPDFWSYILRYSGDDAGKGKGLTHKEMLSNGQTFMTAGTETTATLLSGLFYNLLSDEVRYARLTKEVRSAFETYEDITINNMAGLSYLQACIDEALRIYPPIPVGIARIAPVEGARLGKDVVPKGTKVQLSQHAAYHSALNFKNPDTFIPERWLPEGQSEYGSDRRDVVNPFSYGPRNCVGKNLAYHEMRYITASLVWSFDMKLCPESRNWADQPVWVFWVKPPLVISLVPRQT